MPKPDNVLIVDSRPKRPKYDKGYIPTAISIPFSKFDQMIDKLPKDKNALLIFYCGGPTWKLSHKSAWKAEKLGYTNVKIFANGFPAWKKDPDNYYCVDASYVKKQIDSKAKMVIVDSRPKRPKYDKGHIPTAICIPDSKFDKLKGNLPQDKNISLIFYCGGYTWKLSHKSARKAVQLGYKNVKVFAAGYPAWKKLISATQKTTAIQVKAGEEEGSIDIVNFKKILKENPQSILLIDVRDLDEYAAGSFKTAVNIPTDELEKKINSLPSDKSIVFVCSTGSRSGEAYYMVKDQRPGLKNVYYLEAECTYNKDGSYKIKKSQWFPSGNTPPALLQLLLLSCRSWSLHFSWSFVWFLDRKNIIIYDLKLMKPLESCDKIDNWD